LVSIKYNLTSYRVVHCFIKLIHYYLGDLLDYVDIGDLTVSFLYLAMVVWNFKLSEWVYDKIIHEFFSRNETLLHEVFK